MKTTIRITALLLLLSAAVAFAACGKPKDGPVPNGTYKGVIGTEKVLEFNGNTVKDTFLFKTKTGKVTVDGNKVTITYESGGKDWYIYDPEAETLDFGGSGKWILTKQN